jgi:hypothetical protein
MPIASRPGLRRWTGGSEIRLVETPPINLLLGIEMDDFILNLPRVRPSAVWLARASASWASRLDAALHDVFGGW